MSARSMNSAAIRRNRTRSKAFASICATCCWWPRPGGFGEAQDEQQPGFNAPNVASGGILIVNSAGAVVAASPDAPPFDGVLRDFVDQVAPGRSATGPLTLDASGEHTMTLVLPLFAVL